MFENFAVENLVDMKGGVMSKETLEWAEFLDSVWELFFLP